MDDGVILGAVCWRCSGSRDPKSKMLLAVALAMVLAPIWTFGIVKMVAFQINVSVGCFRAVEKIPRVCASGGLGVGV